MILLMFTSGDLDAKRHKRVKITRGTTYAPGSSSIVLHADTGAILHSDNQHAPRYPASLTKMMTLYLLFEAIEQRKISIKHYLPVSKHASKQSPSKLYLKPGDEISVHDAILALVTKSANDAAVAVAEGLAGSESAFADRMTKKAQQLGMVNTVFRNANGWHNASQKTTAYDMAILLKAIIKKYPRYYKYFGTKTFYFRGQQHNNHNHLLGKYPGMDGGKTGFTCPSGFNLAASAVRSGHRLIAVVLGGATGRSRDNRMAKLLDQSFDQVNGTGLEIAEEVPQQQMVESKEEETIEAPVVEKQVVEETPAEVVPKTIPNVRAMTQTRLMRKLIPVPDSKPRVRAISKVVKPQRNQEHVLRLPGSVSKSNWGVQVGAYGQLKAAQNRAKDVVSRFDKLGKANIQVSPISKKAGRKSKKVYRARIENIPQEQAQKVCSVLKGKKEDCVVFHK